MLGARRDDGDPDGTGHRRRAAPRPSRGVHRSAGAPPGITPRAGLRFGQPTHTFEEPPMSDLPPRRPDARTASRAGRAVRRTGGSGAPPPKRRGRIALVVGIVVVVLAGAAGAAAFLLLRGAPESVLGQGAGNRRRRGGCAPGPRGLAEDEPVPDGREVPGAGLGGRADAEAQRCARQHADRHRAHARGSRVGRRRGGRLRRRGLGHALVRHHGRDRRRGGGERRDAADARRSRMPTTPRPRSKGSRSRSRPRPTSPPWRSSIGVVVIASDQAAMQTVITTANGDTSIQDDAVYQGVSDRLPEDNLGFVFVNVAAARWTWWSAIPGARRWPPGQHRTAPGGPGGRVLRSRPAPTASPWTR